MFGRLLRTRPSLFKVHSSFINKRLVSSLPYRGSMLSFEKCKEIIFGLRGDKYSPEEYKQLMTMHCKEKLNIKYDDLDLIHIAGTKGKGSTAAYTERILRDKGYKTGLFTSPHLISPCERIRINGQPIDEQTFIDAFLILSESYPKEYPVHFFQMVFMMSLKIFQDQQIDVGIIEVGIGGTGDVTNVITPKVCGITLIDYDHLSLLGSTLPEIAGQKAGIIKSGIPVVVSAIQDPSALEVIKNRAKEQNAPIYLVDKEHIEKNDLGISGDHQRVNAALAIQLSNLYIHQKYIDIQDMSIKEQDDIKLSLHNTFWPGRSHYIDISKGEGYNSCELFLDGAHTIKSIEACYTWFNNTRNKVKDNTKVILLFNVTETRDYRMFLDFLASRLNNDNTCVFDYCIFTNFDTGLHTSPQTQSSDFQEKLKNIWETIHPSTNIIIAKNIPNAIDELLTLSTKHNIQCVTTGSLYLVGGILEVLQNRGVQIKV